MYQITVTGTNRYAEFIFNEETKILTKTMPAGSWEKPEGDLLTVTINESSEKSNLVQRWLFMSVTPNQIVKMVDTKYPIVKMKSTKLFHILDNVNADEEVNLLYAPIQSSDIIQKSVIYKALYACQTSIIEIVFGLPEDSIVAL